MDTGDRVDITPGHNGESETPTSANPVADPQERQQRLTEIMRTTAATAAAFPALVKTGHIIQSIDVLNRMDNLYNVPFGFNDNRVINIICDGRTADLIAGIAERTKLQPPGLQPDNALTPDINENDREEKTDIQDREKTYD